MSLISVIWCFLGFDSTHWPKNDHQTHLFEQFRSWVLSQQQTAIVISSIWRFSFGLDELKEYVDPDIEHRVIGMIDLDDENFPGSRQQLIERYVHQHQKRRAAQDTRLAHTPVRYATLDDTAALFTPGWPHLILCDASVGLTPGLLAALQAQFGS